MCEQLAPALHAELARRARQQHTHRGIGDAERIGRLLRGLPDREIGDDLALAIRERLEPGAARLVLARDDIALAAAFVAVDQRPPRAGQRGPAAERIAIAGARRAGE